MNNHEPRAEQAGRKTARWGESPDEPLRSSLFSLSPARADARPTDATAPRGEAPRKIHRDCE